MRYFTSKLLVPVCTLLALGLVLRAQAPTGTITGIVTDAQGAAIANVTVTITEKATGAARTVVTNASGLYSAPALPAGDYDVKAEAAGFRTVDRESTVQAGGTFTVNLPMTIGESKEVVTVEAASTQINYETNTVQGVIDRAAVQDLPLNGRSFMQLAVLEPGVTIASGSTAQFNALFTVSVLGAGNRTAYTVDGGNISDSIDTGGGSSSLNLPQDVVQEFQHYVLRKVQRRTAAARIDAVGDVAAIHGVCRAIACAENADGKQRVELRGGAAGDRYTRLEHRKLHEASSIERQILHGRAINHTLHRVGFVVDLRGSSFDGDDFLGLADGHGQVHGEGAAGLHRRLAIHGAKSRRFRFYVIVAGRQSRRAVESRGIRDNRAGRARRLLRDGHGDVGNRGSLRIGYNSGDRARRRLRAKHKTESQQRAYRDQQFRRKIPHGPTSPKPT